MSAQILPVEASLPASRTSFTRRETAPAKPWTLLRIKNSAGLLSAPSLVRHESFQNLQMSASRGSSSNTIASTCPINPEFQVQWPIAKMAMDAADCSLIDTRHGANWSLPGIYGCNTSAGVSDAARILNRP